MRRTFVLAIFLASMVASAQPIKYVRDLGSAAAPPVVCSAYYQLAQYYDTVLTKNQCCQNGAWEDCISVVAIGEPILSCPAGRILYCDPANTFAEDDTLQFSSFGYLTTTASKLSFSDVGLPTAATARSVSAWVLYTGTPGMGPWSYGSAGSLNIFYLTPGTGSSANKLCRGDFVTTDPGPAFCTTTTMNDGLWHHIVAAYDGANLRLYVDGNGTAEATIATTYVTTLSGTGHLSGYFASSESYSLDDVRIYNVALSGANATTLYSTGSHNEQDLLPGNLVAWWKMNDGTGATAADSSGAGRTATQVGGSLTWNTLSRIILGDRGIISTTFIGGLTGVEIQSQVLNDRTTVAISPNGTSPYTDLILSNTSDMMLNVDYIGWGWDSVNSQFQLYSRAEGTSTLDPIGFSATGCRGTGTSGAPPACAADQLFLATDGKVGIGTNLPADKLHIRNDANSITGIRLQNNNAAIVSGGLAHSALTLSDGTYVQQVIMWPLDHTSALLANAAGFTTDRPNGFVFESRTTSSDWKWVKEQAGVYSRWMTLERAAGNLVLEDRASAYVGTTATPGSIVVGASGGAQIGFIQTGNDDYLQFVTHQNGVSHAVRATIDQVGNFGIGVTGPLAKLHVEQAAAADAFRVDDVAGDVTPFVIDQDGNVGVKFPGPMIAPLHVDGTVFSTGYFVSTGAPAVSWVTTGTELLYAPAPPWNGTGILDAINRTTDAMRPISINASDLMLRTSATGATAGITTTYVNLNSLGYLGINVVPSWGIDLNGPAGSVSAGIHITNGTGGDGTIYMRDASAGMIFRTNGANDRLTIENGGNVGIGDTTPASLLTVGNGDLWQVTSAGLTLMPAGATGAGNLALSFTGDTNTGLYNTADTLLFQTNATTRLTISNTSVTVSHRMQGASASVTAAGDLTLGAANQNIVGGATTINAITTTDWSAGASVTLIFTGAPVVKHNTAGGAGTAVILLAGSVDFQASANSVLKLEYDGTQWQECGRKGP